MPFNFLTDKLIDEINVDGKIYKINPSFSNILNVISILDDDSFTPQERTELAVKAFYVGDRPNDTGVAVSELQSFIGLYEEETQETVNKGKKAKDVIDYSEDSDKIFAAFLQQYQINIRDERLHWFEFVALLNNLSDATPTLVYAMGYRAMLIDEDLPVKEKQRLKKIKKQYELKNKKKDVESNNFASSFLDSVMRNKQR